MVEITLPIALQILQTAGILVGIIYYVTIMRNQQKSQKHAEETRQAQLFMQVYQQYTDREWLRQQQEINFLFEFDSFDEFMEKYGPYNNMEGYLTWASRTNFYEGLGMLVYRGLIDASMVDDMLSGAIILFWEKRCEPIIDDLRVAYNNPAACEWVEYLYHQIKPIRDRQHPELKT